MHGPLPVPGMPADIYRPSAAGAFMAWVGIFLMPLHDPHSPTVLCWQPQQTPSSVTLVPVICDKWLCVIPAVNGTQQTQGALPVYAPETQAAISPTASRHFLL